VWIIIIITSFSPEEADRAYYLGSPYRPLPGFNNLKNKRVLED